MGAGSRSREVSAPWQRATLVWMLITLLEALQGTAREIWLSPVLGGVRARQIAIVTGCVLIFAVALLTVRWIRARSRREWWLVGALWVVLTIAFELALGRALGLSWQRIGADYNPAAGGYMLLGLAFMGCAPYWAARLRKIA